MKNKILRLTREEYKELKSKIDTTKTYLVEINGKKIPNEVCFFESMGEQYDFHTLNGTWGKNWSAFDDLMTDLDWLDYDKHILAVNNYKFLLCDEPKSKEILMKYLSDSILPFWEEDVLNTVVGGKTKEFTVYLID